MPYRIKMGCMAQQGYSLHTPQDTLTGYVCRKGLEMRCSTTSVQYTIVLSRLSCADHVSATHVKVIGFQLFVLESKV